MKSSELDGLSWPPDQRLRRGADPSGPARASVHTRNRPGRACSACPARLVQEASLPCRPRGPGCIASAAPKPCARQAGGAREGRATPERQDSAQSV
eukprot:15478329-Alexandrium_andersonii.AAC.1